MAWLSTLKGNDEAEDMTMYYALWIGSIKLSQLSGWHDLLINLCFYMETMFNQSVYICRPLTAKEIEIETKGIIVKSWVGWVMNHSWIIFWWKIKTYKFVDFTWQLKIDLSPVERIYLLHKF